MEGQLCHHGELGAAPPLVVASAPRRKFVVTVIRQNKDDRPPSWIYGATCESRAGENTSYRVKNYLNLR